jgi:hypothetical protein
MSIKKVNQIQKKTEELAQYFGFDDESNELKAGLLLDTATTYIGRVLVDFTSLEHDIELAISGLVSDRSDEPGAFLIKFLRDNSDLIKYFSEAAYIHINFMDGISDKKRTRLQSERESIVRSLREFAQIRNIIAHSKWITMRDDGYVLSKNEFSKKSGRVEALWYKLNAKTLRSILTGIREINLSLLKFIDDARLR